MTQRAAADAMGISEQALSDKLRGRRRFTLVNLERLAEHFGITLSQLLEPPELLVDPPEADDEGGPE